MEWKVLGFKLTSVKKTKQKHFRLICDTERTEQSVAVISSCCLRDTEIFFPQHVAAANKSFMTGVSLDLSPLFVPSISGLYGRFGEFVQNLSLFFFFTQIRKKNKTLPPHKKR